MYCIRIGGTEMPVTYPAATPTYRVMPHPNRAKVEQSGDLTPIVGQTVLSNPLEKGGRLLGILHIRQSEVIKS